MVIKHLILNANCREVSAMLDSYPPCEVGYRVKDDALTEHSPEEPELGRLVPAADPEGAPNDACSLPSTTPRQSARRCSSARHARTGHPHRPQSRFHGAL